MDQTEPLVYKDNNIKICQKYQTEQLRVYLNTMFRVCSPSEALLVNVINFNNDQLEPLVYKDNFIKNR